MPRDRLSRAAVARRGFVLQGQPAMSQSDGTRVPHTAHLTLTPVTEGLLEELLPALVEAAGEVRGQALPSPETLLHSGKPDLFHLLTVPTLEVTSTSRLSCRSSRRCPARTRPFSCRRSSEGSPRRNEADA